VTEIPQLANPADLTYYIDGTHLTAAGQALIAAKIKTVLPAASGAPR
jgi:lysophospholipase L1-like esterase